MEQFLNFVFEKLTLVQNIYDNFKHKHIAETYFKYVGVLALAYLITIPLGDGFRAIMFIPFVFICTTEVLALVYKSEFNISQGNLAFITKVCWFFLVIMQTSITAAAVLIIGAALFIYLDIKEYPSPALNEPDGSPEDSNITTPTSSKKGVVGKLDMYSLPEGVGVGNGGRRISMK